MQFKSLLPVLALGAALSVVPIHAAPQFTTPIAFICGADLSFVQQIQDAGGHFYDPNGTPIDELTYFHDQGVNYVRLRTWVTPADGYNDLTHILAIARQVRALGMKLLIDFHYSNTWADPAHQTKPSAWANLSFADLQTTLYSYTKNVIESLAQQGTLPDMVQVGNEITSGILWDDGKVTGEQNWPNLISLLNAAVRAVHESAPDARIMLHIAGNQAVAQWFFDHIGSQVDFDVIGLSYYPWWTGALSDFETELEFVAARYQKPVILAETGYPFTLGWTDNVKNFVGEPSQLVAGYPATPQGQLAYMNRITQDIKQIPFGLGQGFFYWAPDYIAAPGFGSYWENIAQFDFKWRALPSMQVYGQCKT